MTFPLTREDALNQMADALCAAQIRACNDATEAWKQLAALPPERAGAVAVRLWQAPREMSGGVRAVLFNYLRTIAPPLWETDPALAAKLATALYDNAPTQPDRLDILQRTADKLRPLSREHTVCALGVCRFLFNATACGDLLENHEAQDVRHTAVEKATSILKNMLQDDVPGTVTALTRIGAGTTTLSSLARACFPAAVLRSGRPVVEVLGEVAVQAPALAAATAIALLEETRTTGVVRRGARQAFAEAVKRILDPKTIIRLYTGGTHLVIDRSAEATLRRWLKPSRARGGSAPAVETLAAILQDGRPALIFNTLGADESARTTLLARLLHPTSYKKD